jgi:multidrug efflux pump subunit AcrA (membrane-fusion protein)
MRSPQSSQIASPAPSNSWPEVEELLHEIGELAKSRLAMADFSATVCQHARRTLAAQAVVLWVRDAEQSWRIEAADGVAPDRMLPHGPQGQGPQNNDRSVIARFALDARRSGALEVICAAQSTSALVRRQQNITEAIAELVADFFRSQRIEELGGTDLQWRALSDLVARLHHDLNLEATAYRLANESRRWLDCDRLTVLVCHGSRTQVTAMSGLDHVDRRSDVVRALKRLADSVVAYREPVWYTGIGQTLAPQIEERLHALLELSPATTLAVVPLTKPSLANEPRESASPVAVLIIEQFDRGGNCQGLQERVTQLAPHATTAIAAALQHQRWFALSSTASRWARFAKILLFLSIVAASAAALIVVPADFKIEARGELQPVVRRDVFAPADGVISRVDVEQGQAVKSDATLVELTSLELELELARVDGELQTAHKKLAATQALQLESDRARRDRVERAHEITAEEEELKQHIKGLVRQREILVAQQHELTVHSPLAGKVLTWNVEPLLAARPVRRGQRLMTVADVDGPWQMELRVPDDRMGHVFAARDMQSEPLKISFVLATDPETEHQSKLEKIAFTAESEADARPTVLVTAPADSTHIGSPRPGAEVIAHIDCGRRSLGYVWFHDLVDAVRGWIFY